VLTNLAFLGVGETWPPEDPDTVARLEMYKTNRLLYESRAEEVYGRWVEVLRDNNLEETSYVLNFHQRLSWLWADLIMGEPPEYAVGEPGSDVQVALEDIVEANELDTIGQEVLVDVSRYGDGLFRLRLEEGELKIEGQSPEYWFPVVSESNVRRILFHVLGWTFDRTEATTIVERANGAGMEKTVRYLQIEIHSAGLIEHRVYRLNSDDKIEQQVDGTTLLTDWAEHGDTEETGLEVPMVFHAPGARTTERLHGHDDYTKIDSSMEYLMWVAAQRQVILHKHSDPSVTGPELTQSDTVTTSSGRRMQQSGSRYYEVSADSRIVPSYMTWDGDLAGSFRQTEELWRDVYIQSETSPTAFGHSETGVAESGTSLRLRMAATLKKSERMRRRFDAVLRRAIKAGGELAGVDFSDLSITWADGLPQDELESSQISATDLGSGITSRRTEMIRRYDYTDEQADEELQQIDEEREASMPPALQFPSRNGQGREEGRGAEEETTQRQ
jgi:hypothetical protein